jgi:hypothetical protein
MMLTADQMRSLPDFFTDIPDPRRAQGRRHRLATVLALAAGAVLCGRRGYQAIAQWAQNLGPQARQRFRCRHDDGQHWVPSESILREVLLRVDPVHLDRALQAWPSTARPCATRSTTMVARPTSWASSVITRSSARPQKSRYPAARRR